MKNLVMMELWGKRFYITPGTEVTLYENQVGFDNINGGFVFVDWVKYSGALVSYNKKTEVMSGRIQTECRDINSGNIIKCDNFIELSKDGTFTLTGMDADSNRITLTLEPVADTYLVDAFIAENPELDKLIVEFLKDNPKCLGNDNWSTSVKWKMANDKIKGYLTRTAENKDEKFDEKMFNILLASSVGRPMAELVLAYNKEKGIIKY